jgi:hypothetical protein
VSATDPVSHLRRHRVGFAVGQIADQRLEQSGRTDSVAFFPSGSPSPGGHPAQTLRIYALLTSRIYALMDSRLT